MIVDKNKGITSICYNHLNLPELVTFSGGKYVKYTLVRQFGDAAGIKLKKEFMESETASLVTTDYVAGRHYKDGTLEFFQHSEGRVLKSGSSFAYEFNLTDHLGNVRVTVNEAGTVVQRDDYYPFGLTFNSYTSTNPENQYKYNGMEEQPETEWLQPAEFRMYQADLGRFLMIDPVIKHHESPYAWNTNNPLSFSDPLGSDSTERANAVAQAKLFVKKNSGNDYGQRANNTELQQPGEKKIDCSGLARNCVNKATNKDPNNDGQSHKKGKDENGNTIWKRGVEVLITSPRFHEISLSDIEVGSIVTLNNSSSGTDVKKDLGHTGIIISVTRGEDGNITDLAMIDSGGRPSTGKSGPRETTLISGGTKKYYGKRITGVYKWDSPEIYNGGTLNEVVITAPSLAPKTKTL